MFAKLKKKINDESLSPSTIASTVDESATSSTESGSLFETPKASLSRSESKDDINTLSRKQEQIRKLENTVKDLAASCKERQKEIEGLKQLLHQQEEASTRSLHELQEKHRARKAQLTEGFTLTLERTEQRHLERNAELQRQLDACREENERLVARRSEKEELRDLNTQEVAKVKHLLLLAEQKVSSLESIKSANEETVEQMTSALDAHQTREAELKATVEWLETEIKNERRERQKAESQRTTKEAELREVQKERELLISEHVNARSQLEAELSTSRRQTASAREERDLLRAQTSHNESSREERVTRLTSEVAQLQQRLKDAELLDDEQLLTLKQEREALDAELRECRDCLQRCRSETHEAQVQRARAESELNSCQEERDSAFASRNSLRAQLEQLQATEVESQQKLLLSQEEVMSQRQNISELTQRLVDQKKACDIDERVTRELHQKLADMTEEMQSVRVSHQEACSWREQAQTELEITKDQMNAMRIKLDRLDKEVLAGEEETSRCKQLLAQAERERDDKAQQTSDKDAEVERLAEKTKVLKEQLDVLQQECSELQSRAEASSDLESRLHNSQQEAGNIRQRREELEQELQRAQERIEELEQTAHQARERETELSEQLRQIEEKETEQLTSVDMSGADKRSEDLEQQLAEKAQQVRLQQQRIKDLKSTLQKQLKLAAGASNPRLASLLERDSDSDGGRAEQIGSRVSNVECQTEMNGLVEPQPAKVESRLQPDTGSGSNIGADGTRDWSEHARPLSGLRASEERRPQQSRVSSVRERGSGTDGKNGPPTNFLYMKHVLLKFILAAPEEAAQLTRAVCTVLQLNKDETSLLRKTLAYKNSWFGTKPTL